MCLDDRRFFMNIQSLLKEKNIYFPLKYHGASDFATRWNVKTLIDNQELFRKVISNIKQG